MRCPECGGRIVEDKEIVCSECGLVLGEKLAVEQKYYPKVISNGYYPRKVFKITFPSNPEIFKDEVQRLMHFARGYGIRMSREKLEAIIKYIVKKDVYGCFPKKPMGVRLKEIRMVRSLLIRKGVITPVHQDATDYIRWCLQRLNLDDIKINGKMLYEEVAEVYKQIPNRRMQTKVAVAIYYVCRKNSILVSMEEVASACGVSESTISQNLKLLGWIKNSQL